MNLGAAYMETSRTQEARNIFEELLRQDPDDVMALINLGNTYMKDGKLKRSEQILRSATSLEPDNYLAGINLGIVLEGQSRIDEAIQQYQRLIVMERETPELYTRLAGCFTRKGDFVHARESVENALRLDPDFAPALRILSSLE
jgi:Tfp pilus assembly protein PilF